MPLTKHQTVLDFLQLVESAGIATFGLSHGHAFPHTGLDLPISLYETMGEPQQVTVTVEPGDGLNG